MLTRKEHMARPFVDKETAYQRHREYYAQFVDQNTIDSVLRCISGDQILASTDPHLNDIPLSKWDSLCGASVSGMRITWHGGRALRLAIKFEDLGDYPTLAGLCCVAKEAARQYQEQRKAADG